MMTVEIVSDRVHLFVEAHPPGSPFLQLIDFKGFQHAFVGLDMASGQSLA